MKTAQQIADKFNNDGTEWEVDGTTLDDVCRASAGEIEMNGECWRYEFPDGSAITGNAAGWDIEGSKPFLMLGAE